MTAAVAVCGGGGAFATELPKWGAHIDIEGKLGTERHLGEIDLFLPVAQSHRTLLFANIRARADDHDSHEGNFGLGLRHMLSSGWNVGAYGYYDRRRTGFDHYFDQATFGVEALGRDFDFRANAYLPFGERAKDISSTAGGGSFATLVGTTIEITTLGGFTREERALRGFDAEIGWRVPLWPADDTKALRLYAGMFHFDDSVIEAVSGPRLRAELTMYELPHLPDDARLTLGAEFQDDDVRGSQGFAMARLRIPLQSERRERTLNWQERRMVDYVVRDVDIVTGTRTVQAPSIVETATQTADGSVITVIDSSTTPGANLATAVTNAGANSTVILQGDFGFTVASAADVVQLEAGQTLMGAGQLHVATQSGKTALLTVSTAGRVNAAMSNFVGPAISMGTDSTLTGMTVNAVDSGGVTSVFGVQASGVSGATIANNAISATSSTSNAIGLRIINGATDILVSGNTISGIRTSNGGTSLALQIIDNSSATLTGNSFDATGGAVQYGVYRGGSTALPGSTGNVMVNGTCEIGGGSNNGTIGFTDGSTCP